jgi:xylulokinase
MALWKSDPSLLGGIIVDVVIAVDSSTTSSKAVAFDANGEVVAVGRASIERWSPQPAWHEQDANAWWDSSARALTQLMAELAGEAHTPIALGITHQRESFVCLDAAFEPVRPAILWLDARSGVEVQELGTQRVSSLSGKPPSTTPSFYKIAWLKKHEPGVVESAAHISDVHALLSQRLTGHFATSVASADPMGLIDVASGSWSDELLGEVGVRREQLPTLLAPGELVGRVTSEAAAVTGLPVGLPVVAGGGDGQCAGLGAGITEPGTAYLSLGTSITLGCHVESADFSRSYRLLTSPTGAGLTAESFIASGALSVSWFRQAFPCAGAPETVCVDDAFDASLEATAATQGNLYFLPYLSGSATPYWDDKARGSFVGINEGHGWADFYRAVLEGLAFEIALLLKGLQQGGERIDSAVVTGGGSASDRWLHIIADITGVPLRVAGTTEATALGAAMLAAAAVGFAGTGLEQVVAAMSSTARVVAPRDEQHLRAKQRLGTYELIYGALAPVFEKSSHVDMAAGAATGMLEGNEA